MADVFRVLHIVPALFGNNGGVTGGAERYAFELAMHMADEVPTTLISFGSENRSDTLGRMNLRVIGDPWYFRGQRTNPISLSLLPGLIKAEVVHCHQQHVISSSLAALVGRLTGRKVFVSDLGGGGWDISAYVSTDSWYRGHLHISEYSRTVFGHRNNPSAHVILGGVDTEKFSPAEYVSRTNTALFVGRLLPHKGIDNIIEALPAGMALEIVGQPYDQGYVNDLRALAEGKQVSFLHDCDDQALVMAYRRALCVLLPSVYKNRYGTETKIPELLGQTLLEGMACGVPAVCTNVASMPEIVDDGVTGFVVPPNDPLVLGQKLEWLRDHPEEAKQMGQAARQHILEKFTWPAVVRRCLEIYAA